MKILVAPNAFKGSLSCVDAARAMALGVHDAFREAHVTAIPVADGGDGLLDALRGAWGGVLVQAPVHGPRGEKRRASYLWIASRKTAVIEMARASGLALVPPARRRVMRATSRGTGDLMRDAVRRGARTLIVGMGGAASNDGGAGMARALGARLLDAAGREIPDGAASLPRLARVEARAVRSLLSGVSVLALSDVRNPLLGAKGSARVFGPQKGAGAREVRQLETALTHWAFVLRRDLGVSVAHARGAGAAGGLGAGLLAFADARIVSGAEFVLSACGALRVAATADLVVTGEGRLDRTSLYGKATVALARRSKRCVAVAGQVEKGLRRPFARVVSFADAGAKSERDAMRRAARWARKAAALAVAVLAMAALLPETARSTDIDFHGLDAQYLNRHMGANLADNLAALEKLNGVQSGADGQVLWRLCRVRVRATEKLEARKEKLTGYEAATKECEKGAALVPNEADAHFWHGVALGRWAETKGMMKALFAIKTIKKEMAETLRLNASHGGAHNVRGEILWQVPGFAGGDKRKALEEFESALRLSPRYTANHMPLAKAYLYFKRKDDAIRVLKQVEETKDAADPAEYPENLADAKALLADLEGKK